MAGEGGREETERAAPGERCLRRTSKVVGRKEREMREGGRCSDVFEEHISQHEACIREGSQFVFHQHRNGTHKHREEKVQLAVPSARRLDKCCFLLMRFPWGHFSFLPRCIFLPPQNGLCPRTTIEYGNGIVITTTPTTCLGGDELTRASLRERWFNISDRSSTCIS